MAQLSFRPQVEIIPPDVLRSLPAIEMTRRSKHQAFRDDKQ